MCRITDITESGIYTDLMREFIRLGHKTYIATPLERRYDEPYTVIRGEGYEILPIKTLNLQKTNLIEKGIGILLLESQYKKAIHKHWGDIKFDLVLYSTPPITFNNVIEWQKEKGAFTYLMLKDIFPQNAVDLGLMKKGSLIWILFNKKEKHLYDISDYIGCMSPANCKYLLVHNPSIIPQKVEVCPNCIEIKESQNVFSDIDSTSTLFDNGYPVCIYGGNLGKPQGVDFILKVLDALKNQKVNVCIIGSGTDSHKLHEWKVSNPGIKNIKVMESLPKEEYDKLIAKADIGMIFLDRRFTIPNFPSRLLSYLENKLPVILATDKNTDIGQIAEASNFGLWSESGDLDSFLSNLFWFINHPTERKKMGDNGYRFLKENYTSQKVATIILSHTKK